MDNDPNLEDTTTCHSILEFLYFYFYFLFFLSIFLDLIFLFFFFFFCFLDNEDACKGPSSLVVSITEDLVRALE